MEYGLLNSWILSCLLAGLRIAPIFVFAPPFTLVRVPAMARMLFGLGLSICLVGSGRPELAYTGGGVGDLLVMALRELLIGVSLVMMFQIAFAALQVAGRTIDIQAGFGLAMLIDPTTRAQTPLIGTLFAYAAGAIFFAMSGHHEVLRLLAASFEAIPLGQGDVPDSLGRLAGFLSASFLIAFGVSGAAILTLFLADLAIALLSRTVPQMNVLMLGLQVKTLLLLIILAATFGMTTALIARLMALMLTSASGVLARG